MEVATLEGLDGAPGKQKRQSGRRTHEVVEVRQNEDGHCVPAAYGPPGSAMGQRLIDLCSNAGIPTMKVAGRIYDTRTGEIQRGTSGLEGATMDEYEAMEFPAIEGLEMVDGIVDKSYVVSNLKTLGFQILSRIASNGLAELSSLPKIQFKGSKYVYPASRAVLGLVGGRLLFNVSPELGRVLTSRVLERALIDDLLLPLLPASVKSYAGAVFGTVDIEPQRMLASLSPEEVRALGTVSIERQLGTVGIERQLGVTDIQEQISSSQDDELILSAINPRYAEARRSGMGVVLAGC